MDVLDQYKERLVAFTKVDDTNLSDRLKQIPAEKQFWNTQFVDAKINLFKMEKKRKSAGKTITEKIVADSEVTLNKKTLDDLVKGKLEEVDEKIQEQKFLIEWLELTAKSISFMAQDFKNIIELKKIEEI